MNGRTLDRLFAACGIGSVVLQLVGAVVGFAGGRPMLTLDASAADVAKELASPAGPLAWAGAYLELVSFGAFVAFAFWACAKLGGGLLGGIAQAMALAYATICIVSLGAVHTVMVRQGHGLDLQVARTLTDLNSVLYISAWFVGAFFLLAAGPLALSAGRRKLGWTAIGIAAFTLVVVAIDVNNLGQNATWLFLFWIVGASIALARGGERRRAQAPAVATV
jgi:hypothetical protein